MIEIIILLVVLSSSGTKAVGVQCDTTLFEPLLVPPPPRLDTYYCTTVRRNGRIG
jgi:hypothetical protein